MHKEQRFDLHFEKIMVYCPYGALAQLGARHTGSVEATGSSPVCSILQGRAMWSLFKRRLHEDRMNQITMAHEKGGEHMPISLEIVKTAIDDFAKVQRRMILAKKENAPETYADLKEEYISLKALLNIAGVNLNELDKIKE